MDERILKLTTPKECANMAKNARERGRPDLAEQALKRSIQIKAEQFGSTSDVEKEAIQAIYAYEELLFKKNGKRTRASRTWQMIKRHGIIAAVERVVSRPEEAMGYKVLAEMGLEEYAFEQVVINHPDCFSAEALGRAKSRMASWRGDS